MSWEKYKFAQADHHCKMDSNPEYPEIFILNAVFALCLGTSEVDSGSQCPGTSRPIPCNHPGSRLSHATHCLQTDSNPVSKIAQKCQNNRNMVSTDPMWAWTHVYCLEIMAHVFGPSNQVVLNSKPSQYLPSSLCTEYFMVYSIFRDSLL